jgi:hypothetical protein
LLLVPATALAEEPPQFVEMGPDGGRTELAADLAGAHVGGEGDVWRLGLMGQYVGARGTGGYLSLAGSHYEGSGIGGLDVGGLYRSSGKRLRFLLRGGVIVPTSHAYYLDPAETAQTLGTFVVHPIDYAATVPAVTSLRIALSPTWRSGSGRTFVRADVGIDAAIAGDLKEDAGTTLHGALGVGFVRGTLAATVELCTIRYHARDYEFAHGLGASFQSRNGNLTTYVGLATLFGNGGTDLAVTTGVRWGFHL